MPSIPTGNSVITLVEKQKKNRHRYNVYINEDFAFSVHEDVLIKHRLFRDQQIDEKQLTVILDDEEMHKVQQCAMRFIERRHHSEKEIRDKLQQKGYESSLIDSTIKQMV